MHFYHTKYYVLCIFDHIDLTNLSQLIDFIEVIKVHGGPSNARIIVRS